MLARTTKSMFSPSRTVSLPRTSDNCVALRTETSTATVQPADARGSGVSSPQCVLHCAESHRRTDSRPLSANSCKAQTTRAISPPMPIAPSGAATLPATAAPTEQQTSSISDLVWKLAFRAVFQELLSKPGRLMRHAARYPFTAWREGLDELQSSSGECSWEFALQTFTDKLETKCNMLQRLESNCARDTASPLAVLPANARDVVPGQQPLQLVATFSPRPCTHGRGAEFMHERFSPSRSARYDQNAP